MNAGVSVVIPAYNYAKYLGETLTSVFAQTYAPEEVIVVDDGSTDQTRRVVQGFSDPRLRYIYQSNQGLSAARNTGIANARYPYVTFLDADDVWFPELLETAMQRFSQLPQEFGVVATGWVRITMDGQFIDRPNDPRKMLGSREIKASDIAVRTRFLSSGIIVRREVFEQVGGFNTTLRSSEDREMWIRIARKRRIYFTQEPLAKIRRHGKSMSRNADRMRTNMRKVLAAYFRDTGVASPERLKVFCKAYAFNQFEVGWMYYDEERFMEAIWAMMVSLFCWPCFFRARYDLNEPLFFRPRALIRFICAACGIKHLHT